MPRSSVAPAWTGAPPVSDGNFSFVNGELFAQTSGQRHHRRATLEELKTHFAPGSNNDHPAHWFEAQLIHYGLQPSKTKAVARMRLLDAVNSERLLVPSSITDLECKLKKEWMKQDKEAKKAQAKGGSGPKIDTKVISTTTVGSKRKAADVTVSVIVKTKATPSNSTNQSKAKKARTTKEPIPKKSSSSAKAKTTRPRRAGIAQKSARGEREITLPPPPVRQPKQTARENNATVARGRIPAPRLQNDSHDDFDQDSPPPYSEYDGEDETHENDEVALAPLGHLNGRYDISSPDVTDEWPAYGSNFELNLMLSGSTLWGEFHLGVIEGVIRFEGRPGHSSYEEVPFQWRGSEAGENLGFFDDRNEGWIKFLGGGRIEGYIDSHRIEFQGQRKSEQSNKGWVGVNVMQSKWDEFEEEERRWW